MKYAIFMICCVAMSAAHAADDRFNPNANDSGYVFGGERVWAKTDEASLQKYCSRVDATNILDEANESGYKFDDVIFANIPTRAMQGLSLKNQEQIEDSDDESDYVLVERESEKVDTLLTPVGDVEKFIMVGTVRCPIVHARNEK